MFRMVKSVDFKHYLATLQMLFQTVKLQFTITEARIDYVHSDAMKQLMIRTCGSVQIEITDQ